MEVAAFPVPKAEAAGPPEALAWSLELVTVSLVTYSASESKPQAHPRNRGGNTLPLDGRSCKVWVAFWGTYQTNFSVAFVTA